MPIPAEIHGATVAPLIHEVDARWTMAYAAALDDNNPRYFDTTASAGVVAHPLFAVCPEWPVIVAWRSQAATFGITPDEDRRSVHATHDTTIHRLVRPGDVLSTALEVVGVEQRRPGAFVTTRLTTTDAEGHPVATTNQGGIYLDVPLEGVAHPASGSADERVPPERAPLAEGDVAIAAGAAHTYTECARIWNPIHTDRAIAIGAGLPDIILHGTATLAHAVSRVVDLESDGDPNRVSRILGRFRSMVLMPSTISVRILDRRTLSGGDTAIDFDVRTEQGEPAVDRGTVVLRPPS